MAYTVKELAQLSGVSVRTLHFYDDPQHPKLARFMADAMRVFAERELQ